MEDNLPSEQGTKPGDLTWVRLDRRSRLWWPAQVVEDTSSNDKWKRKKKAAGDVLVRLYGTYSYLYTNPSIEGPEFEKDLIRYGISPREAFKKALEKDMAQILGGQHEKAEMEDHTTINAKKSRKVGNTLMTDPASESKAQMSKGNPKKRKAKTQVQSPEVVAAEGETNEIKGSSNACRSLGVDISKPVNTPSSSSRRIRIMRSLALIPPEGSPFKIQHHPVEGE